MAGVRTGVPCARGYAWCVEEVCRPSVDGSAARFHLGAASVVRAGDDEITCLLIAPEDVDAEPYVELELAAQGRRAGVWLSVAEVEMLSAALDERKFDSGRAVS